MKKNLTSLLLTMLMTSQIVALESKDFNKDGTINQQDIASVIENLNTTEEIYDVDSSGNVGIFDLAQTYWGTKINIDDFDGDIKTASTVYNIIDQIDNLFIDKTYTSVDVNTKISEVNILMTQLKNLELKGNFETFLQELQIIKDLLETGNSNLIGHLLTVNQERQFSDNLEGMLSDLQPIGAVGMYGEEVVIYVEADSSKGLPELIFSQYYGDPEKYYESIKLREGRNIISVPIIEDSGNKGGSIYVKYDEMLQKDIKLHIANAISIPMLDLEIIDENIKDEIEKYIRKLREYVEQLDNKNLKYNPLNSTEIGTSKILVSIPASQFLSALGDEDITSQVDKLYETLQAWDNVMDEYYSKFGIVGTDVPTKRLNIRYMENDSTVSEYIGISFDTVPMLITETINGTNEYLSWILQFLT
ncbi:hypothetical protein AN639_12015 [Candidatus Epulonipiscium fishelsonii]|uniref:Uncharacterized protein n=1 Tax=Candidatus Epulonipiscium fishelsonii TaxID=77094 RepID=A0ACC8XCQ5_9FIRM|nr:hypothetical protein AN396_06060 [Epulopiscium sp. SCG-B11WGA-EpuloA1]ONI42730.1 hypothetical protein AN639_12015 [Epulopiscium sp. SCG-B05WGA-EpuloA1]